MTHRNSDQAVNCFHKRHGGAIPFALKRAFQKNVPVSAGSENLEPQGCGCPERSRGEDQIATGLCDCDEYQEGP
jgi:hypothetical protein